MKKLKEFKIVLLILLVVLVLVIVKSTGKNRFKQDAKSAIETITSNNFSVSLTDFSVAENQYLVVVLNESGSVQFENSIKVPFEKLIDENILQKLKETDNKILLISGNNSIALKAWVILNQLGFKNVFVLSDEETPEGLKYKFQPD
jgi:uncharacterized protein (UPF0333 family)